MKQTVNVLKDREEKTIFPHQKIKLLVKYIFTSTKNIQLLPIMTLIDYENIKTFQEVTIIQ